MKRTQPRRNPGERPSASFSRKDATLRMLAPWEYARAAGILKEAKLMADDLSDARVAMFGLYDGDTMYALGGFERYGKDALLRSMVVPPNLRNRGLGARLLTGLEALLWANGVENIWLLTMTAAHFFKRNGYRSVERARAPESIRNTGQFSGLCPASATLMLKKRSPSDG